MSYNTFISFGFEMTDLYIYLSVILFVCLTCVASKGIQTIIDDVQSQTSIFHNESGNRVRKWRQSYGMIHDFIEEVDQFFGPVLLIFFARMFVIFVITVFQLTLVELKESNDKVTVTDRIVYFTKVIIYIPMVAFRSHKMKQQVNYLSNRLYKPLFHHT